MNQKIEGENMNIGIDIDGVLTDFEKWQLEVGSKFFFKYGKRIIHPNGYDSDTVFCVSKTLDSEFWKEYLYDYVKNEPARRYAGEVIKKLHQEGNMIYIITARYLTNREDKQGKQMRKIVIQWLRKNNIYYDKIIFSPEEKMEICKKNNIDVMIEDSTQNINCISDIIPVICFDARYNQSCKGENISRCYTWYDIYFKLKEIKQKRIMNKK